MGHKRTWYGTIAHVARRFTHPEQVSVSVRLDEGVPAKDIGRVVEIHLTPERALDWSTELASHARSARRRNGAPRLTDSDRISEMERIRRNYAEDHGSNEDPVEDSLADLIADLLKVAERHGVEPDIVVWRALEYARETADSEIRYF